MDLKIVLSFGKELYKVINNQNGFSVMWTDFLYLYTANEPWWIEIGCATRNFDY